MSKLIGQKKHEIIQSLLAKCPDVSHWLIDHVIKNDVYSLFKLWGENVEFKHGIDLGANEGVFTYVFSQLWPDAEIVSFEPIKVCNEIFEKINGGNDKVILVPAALSYRDGVDQLYYQVLDNGTPNWGCASLVPPKGHMATKCKSMEIVTIGVNTFAGYLPVDRSEAYFKMDIEGFEHYLIMERGRFLFDWKAFGCELHLNLITALGGNNHGVNDLLVSLNRRYKRIDFVADHWLALITRVGPLELTCIN